jgi:hypothetical protein
MFWTFKLSFDVGILAFYWLGNSFGLLEKMRIFSSSGNTYCEKRLAKMLMTIGCTYLTDS